MTRERIHSTQSHKSNPYRHLLALVGHDTHRLRRGQGVGREAEYKSPLWEDDLELCILVATPRPHRRALPHVLLLLWVRAICPLLRIWCAGRLRRSKAGGTVLDGATDAGK